MKTSRGFLGRRPGRTGHVFSPSWCGRKGEPRNSFSVLHALNGSPARFALLLLLLRWLAVPALAQIRAGGVDPANLGPGDWIYVLSDATNRLGGSVPGVTNLASLMAYEKNQGMRYLIVKAATSDGLYPSSAQPQFTATLVSRAHAAGLQLFGYNRSYGTNVPGEIAIADYVFRLGADGFVFDAEAEWESNRLPNNAAAAVQLCGTIRTNWPDKFLAHSPFPIVSYHSTFPYKEFGYYCDAVMPQAYWKSIGVTPAYLVQWMDTEWHAWQNSLAGRWTNAIKPLAPVGQGWSPSVAQPVTAAEITAFVNALKNDVHPANRGGYHGVNYWRAELHTPEQWDALRTNAIGPAPPDAPILANVSVGPITDTSGTITWTTDQSADSVVEYGLTGGYGDMVTNPTLLWYHTVALNGLRPDTTYHFRVGAKNAGGQQVVSGDQLFTTAAASVPDLLLDTEAATFSGGWTTSTSSPDKYGSDYRFAVTAADADSALATFTPNIPVTGQYDVFVWFPGGGNRATNAPYTIAYDSGIFTVGLDQTPTFLGWVLIGSSLTFRQGTSGWVRLSNHTGYAGKVVIADAVKLVYVPPSVPPRFRSVARLPDDSVRLVLSSQPGRSVGIQSSCDLRSWTDFTNLLNATGTVEFSDRSPLNTGQRFYRARQ